MSVTRITNKIFFKLFLDWIRGNLLKFWNSHNIRLLPCVRDVKGCEAGDFYEVKITGANAKPEGARPGALRRGTPILIFGFR